MMVLWLLFSGVPMAHAHAMIIEPLENQRVLVQYDGGGFSRRTVVTVVDAMGHVLEEGKLDAEGVYDYSHLPEAHTLLADDGMGHRAEWVVGTTHHQLPKLPVVAGVWGMFGGIAWHFKRKQQQNNQ